MTLWRQKLGIEDPVETETVALHSHGLGVKGKTLSLFIFWTPKATNSNILSYCYHLCPGVINGQVSFFKKI